MGEIRSQLIQVCEETAPTTCRAVFYQMVSRFDLPKTEAEYKGTVIRLLRELRLDGSISWDAITDGTRFMSVPTTYANMDEALWQTTKGYRRDRWDSQPFYVEVWLEKDALSGLLYQETAVRQVPLMVTRGYSSLTFLHESAESIANKLLGGKEAVILNVGDHDPSGLDAWRNAQQMLTRFVSEVAGTEVARRRLYFERIAVTPQQIEAMDLVTRPTKASDTRAAGFSGRSVEVDAIPSGNLRRLVRDELDRWVDDDLWDASATVESRERSELENFRATFGLIDHGA